MTDTMTVFRLYRRAQEFLALNSDEGIDPDNYSAGEGSEAELLIAELAAALSDSFPEADADEDNAFRVEACKRFPHDDSADLRGAFIDGANHGYQATGRTR